VKAIVYTRYGPPDALRLTDVDTPVPVGDQVLAASPWLPADIEIGFGFEVSL
jgi:NADPH:quinone reductase-like Zn-dependent oxidoreductase